jgi:hypothetical protein
MSADVQFHLTRARAERDIAYRASDPRVGDAHMRLSALHLDRALRLQQVQPGAANVDDPPRPAAALLRPAAMAQAAGASRAAG